MGTKQEILSEEEIKKIFPHIEVILSFNKKLLQELEDRLRKNALLGDVFLKMKDFFKVYIEYGDLYSSAVETIAKCKKNSDFQAFLKRAHDHPSSGGLSLIDFLIQPIQRIPRYQLLLQNLLKYTDRRDPDYDNIAFALQKVIEIANRINDRQKDHDIFQAVIDIHHKLLPKLPDLVEPHRRFIKEGPIIFAKSRTARHKKRYVFLFNDLMLVTKYLKMENKYWLRYHITLANTKVKDLNSIGDDHHGFVLHTPSTSLLIFLSNKQEKDAWKNIINDCLSALQRKRDTIRNVLDSKLVM